VLIKFKIFRQVPKFVERLLRCSIHLYHCNTPERLNLFSHLVLASFTKIYGRIPISVKVVTTITGILPEDIHEVFFTR
jgi:hypothetical protein